MTLGLFCGGMALVVVQTAFEAAGQRRIADRIAKTFVVLRRRDKPRPMPAGLPFGA